MRIYIIIGKTPLYSTENESLNHLNNLQLTSEDNFDKNIMLNKLQRLIF